MTTTDTTGSHHLWRPLAAISLKEMRPFGATASNAYGKGAGPPALTNKAMVSGLLAVMNNVSSATTSSTDEDNSVWYKIESSVRGSGNGPFGQTNSTYVFDGFFNSTSDLFDPANRTNGTADRPEDTFEVITMIGTAVILGLLILATVIGKLLLSALKNLVTTSVIVIPRDHVLTTK